MHSGIQLVNMMGHGVRFCWDFEQSDEHGDENVGENITRGSSVGNAARALKKVGDT